MGACCTKDYMYGGGYMTYDKDERDSNGADGEEVRRGDDGATIRLRGSSVFTSMFTQRGRKGINQDAMTVWEDFSGEKDLVFCGVFDGHGPSGHRVARHARDVFPTKLAKAIKKQLSQPENGVVSEAFVEPDNNGGNQRNRLVSKWEAALEESFKEFDQELSLDSSIDCFCSGTTAVTIIKQGENLVVANLGDSRAVLCTRGDKHQQIPIQLTVDQKPNIPCEAERIKNCQGRIIAEKEEPDIYRVWVPDADYPGLAMSRSLGDFCLKDYGLISTPQVSYRKLTRKDEFIVIATDGIWDVLTNKQVINIVASARNRSMAAKLVVKLAVREWKRRFPGSMIDDCAVICLFFKNPPLLTKSMTSVGRRNVRSHPELTVSRSCRSMGIDRKRGRDEEEGGPVKRDCCSKEDRKGVQGLSRANSLTRATRYTRTLSHNQRMGKFYHEVEAR
ncbi:probable protein phosphatase 2C 65 [Benincasa hispida]|uniref:probable protein phosphatase 2C 65 n=1 Tax=Benincasa hispida TaxID=102211 RepID=UPI001902B988|nr:probable protein phosphatase 2C 65 [Benincasa hispida]